MKALKQNAGGIFLCLFEILVGILLLINPTGFTSGIIITFGIIMLIVGIVSIIQYFRMDAQEASVNRTLFKGLVSLLIGAFCAFRSNWFIITFPILTIIYGVYVFITGLGKIQWTFDRIRLKQGKWFLSALSAVVSIICSVVILNNPFTSMSVLWLFIGLFLIVDSIVDIIAMLTGSKEKVETE